MSSSSSSSSQTVKKCVLKRCQGKRGCICPTGTVIGTYTGRKITQIINNVNNNNVNVNIKSIEIPVTTAMYNSLDSGDNMNQLKSISTMKGDRSNVYQTYNISDNEKNNAYNTSTISNQSQSSSSSSKATTSNLNHIKQDYSHFNGEVMIRYNHYKKKFLVVNGTTNSNLIDEQYFLSFAFPKSKIHISLYGPNDFSFEEEGLHTRPLLPEDPVGVYIGVDPSKEYWVEIEEDVQERLAYEERQEQLIKQNNSKRQSSSNGNDDDDEGDVSLNIINVTKTESCSCIEGNPCLDRYACRNWEMRYEIAKKNGWKGFQ